MIHTHYNQRGFSLVAAIFLLVVLSALGAFMVTFSNTQNITSAQDIQGSRAYWAARAGLAWAIGSISADPAADPAKCFAGAPPANVNGFALTVVCSKSLYNESGVDKRVFRLTSTAATGGAVGSIGRVERSLSATVEY